LIPGMGGINPKKMQAMMKQMGINQVEIDASKVIIEKNDGGNIVIDNPSIQKIVMQGQESFQISGDISEDEGFKDEDIRLIVEKTGKSEDEAKRALEETGDMAQAILKLNS
jgi:nascent polypeptide-associated complex subunit alpha